MGKVQDIGTNIVVVPGSCYVDKHFTHHIATFNIPYFEQSKQL